MKPTALRCANPDCGKPLSRREGEHNTNFLRRRHCNRSCGCMIAVMRRGQHLEQRRVPCAGCGTPVLRSVHFADARCPECKKIKNREAENAYNAKLREQAKRYRRLMGVLGFDSYEELLAYLATVPWTAIDGRRRRGLIAKVEAA